jgi:hypothetical protein
MTIANLPFPARPFPPGHTQYAPAAGTRYLTCLVQLAKPRGRPT